ncbi:MAG: glycosyltransferase [Pseudomonadota bacterium]|nr:glycosyltransferase [Pseudomonadota bacterium]
MTIKEAFSTAPDRGSRDRFRSFLYQTALDVYTLVGTRLAPQRAPYMPGMPIRVEGFHGEILGIGETARQFHRALEQAGHPVERLSIDRRLRPDTAPEGAGLLRLSHLNPDQLLEYAMRVATPNERRAPHVGYWVWELPAAPGHWRAAARLVDRIWAPSRFAADAIEAVLPDGRSVDVLPPPVFAHGTEAAPPRIDDAGEAVRILAVCDLRSSAARKNPMGALEAFDMARERGAEAARLVLKITAGDQCPDVLSQLAARVADRADITLIDQPLSDGGMLGLIAACDIALCLHRSEGFGLLAAHAAYRGKPVIATNWSAPTEFLTAEGAGLVDYTLVPVEDPQGIYPPGQMWAEPDTAHAADWLVRLTGDAALRDEMGRRAGRDARARLGPEAWQTRLSELLDGLPGPAA